MEEENVSDQFIQDLVLVQSFAQTYVFVMVSRLTAMSVKKKQSAAKCIQFCYFGIWCVSGNSTDLVFMLAKLADKSDIIQNNNIHFWDVQFF